MKKVHIMGKNNSIYIRCTKEEKENIRINAELRGMNLSEYLRSKGMQFEVPEKHSEQMELVDFLKM